MSEIIVHVCALAIVLAAYYFIRSPRLRCWGGILCLASGWVAVLTWSSMHVMGLEVGLLGVYAIALGAALIFHRQRFSRSER
ncbi:hypothetical protein [Phytopseudomonas dryadis]|uniref:Uncharacterized protein n=1 Tax=Phytopseudomonas dryadis TaxID=2487520 RepID=A0A4V2KCV3_9GAMM|nr:hypothetical protein [Pseudomonas dryadis]TBU96377.1 hypothetical protein DNK44_04295 [Pseudomonas dryadis]